MRAERSAQDLLDMYDITAEDLAVIRSCEAHVSGSITEYVEQFYTWLRMQPEFAEFFSTPETLRRAQTQQMSYWKEFFHAQVDESYLTSRRLVGQVHARIGLPLAVYFAAMSKSIKIFLNILEKSITSSHERSRAAMAITRLVHLDTSVVVDTFSELTNQQIAEQSQTLMKMSTPVTAIWEGILILPVVGIIDSRRAQDMMNAMLSKIAETQSKVIILDISGVGVVDTAVANHLIKITKATKLMGCACTISGLSPAIAQTIVELGVDVGEVKTTATLKDALEDAFKVTGVELKRVR